MVDFGRVKEEVVGWSQCVIVSSLLAVGVVVVLPWAIPAGLKLAMRKKRLDGIIPSNSRAAAEPEEVTGSE